jgi:hypothetical protein
MRRDSDARAGPGVVAYTGLTLSLVGALLDFASGYALAPMGGGMASAYIAEASLYFLGAVVLVVGALSVTSVMANRMKWSGIGMEVLGVVMAVVSGLVPGMNGGLSDAMLVVGALMIINGALMQRNRGMKAEKVP